MSAENVTPTEYLILEVLAARLRLGERVWTFERRNIKAVRALAEKGLIGYKSGVVENALICWLTDTGRAIWLLPTYIAPKGCEFCDSDEEQKYTHCPSCDWHVGNDPEEVPACPICGEEL